MLLLRGINQAVIRSTLGQSSIYITVDLHGEADLNDMDEDCATLAVGTEPAVEERRDARSTKLRYFTMNDPHSDGKRGPLGYIIWVYVALGVLLVGMIALVALDDANAQYYIDAFQTLLSWPVLAFSLVMIVLLIFHSDLANVFKGYYISRVGRDAVHFEPKPQPDPPANERPILPADDPTAQPTPRPAPDITDNDAYVRGYDDGWKLGLASANEQIETWEQEANHWWHRYLTTFLTPETQQLLRQIGDRPRTSAELRQQAAQTTDVVLNGQMLTHALNALDKYDLIERNDSGTETIYRITDDGRAFLAFLDSPEGEEFARETLDERGPLLSL